MLALKPVRRLDIRSLLASSNPFTDPFLRVLVLMKLNNTEISPADNVLDLDLSEIAEKSINALKIRVTDSKTGNRWLGYLSIMTNSTGQPRVEIMVERATTRTSKVLLLNKVKVK